MIKLEYTYGGKNPITMQLDDDDASLPECIELFESFLLAMGYSAAAVKEYFSEA